MHGRNERPTRITSSRAACATFLAFLSAAVLAFAWQGVTRYEHLPTVLRAMPLFLILFALSLRLMLRRSHVL